MSDVRLNAQGMSRGYRPLMECIISDPGYTTISVDLKSGEPTATSHYSRDKNYTYANFTGVGKNPYYENKILFLDDMYLMGASVSPTGQEKMLELFNTTFKGVSFQEQWVIDPDVVKKDSNVKTLRAFHKTLILAMQYGQGPTGMVISAEDSGQKLKIGQAKTFHKAFWYTLFPDVRKLGERLKLYVKKNKYIVNDFGYRSFPIQRKALNYYIQSTISGIIDVLMIKFYSICPYAQHHAVIHDEIVFSVPDDKVKEAKELLDKAVKSLNDDLKWSVNVRAGWVEGKNWYEAH